MPSGTILEKRDFAYLREWCEKRKMRHVDIDLRWDYNHTNGPGSPWQINDSRKLPQRASNLRIFSHGTKYFSLFYYSNSSIISVPGFSGGYFL